MSSGVNEPNSRPTWLTTPYCCASLSDLSGGFALRWSHPLQNGSKPFDCARKPVPTRGEAETEMRRLAEAIARNQKHATLRHSSTEPAGIHTAGEPWKRRHAPGWANPLK